MTTFAEVLRSRAGDEHDALIFENRRWTWAEVVQESCDRAALLESWRCATRARVHVGVLLENGPEYLFWLGAAALSGDVVVGINATRRGAELAADIRHTDCSMIVVDDRHVDLLDGIDHRVPPGRVINVDEPTYPTRLTRGAPLPETLPRPEDVYFLMFSSGSTGAPKAVIFSQGRFGALAKGLTERTGIDRDSVTYLCMPMFHANALTLNIGPSTFVGATICMVRRFSASGFVRDLHDHRFTYVNYVGRALSYILAVPEDPRDEASSLRMALGTEASVADIERFSRRFGCLVSEGYGMSEGVLRINRTPDTPQDSLGLPIGDVDVRILNEETAAECARAVFDDTGRIANAGQAIGQIVAMGQASNFEGYYNNAEAFAERVRGADFWTGDLGYRDPDGFFYFAGRSTDWLRVDSENFAAAPVERIIGRWDKAEAALVYPVPDARTGDQVMCALRLVPGARFDPSGFTAFLDAQSDLGTKWRPRYLRLLDAVPTTGSNKVVKTGLRHEAWVTHDPVYLRSDAPGGYRPMTRHDLDALAKEFAEHGRTAFLPQ